MLKFSPCELFQVLEPAVKLIQNGGVVPRDVEEPLTTVRFRLRLKALANISLGLPGVEGPVAEETEET